MKSNEMNRRRFIRAVLLLTPCLVAADAAVIEPEWVELRRLRLTEGKPTHRFVHFSDLHHKGDRNHARAVVNLINSQSPDFVCFTGDIMEQAKFLPEALEILSGIKSPVFGVPGNHDYWSRAPFAEIRKCFAATGGAWLLDEQRTIADGRINLMGATCMTWTRPQPSPDPAVKNILLMHYPAWVRNLVNLKFDLILAGHSHGGQVRIPFYGPIILPTGVGEYDLGLFQTQAGPLYVSSGIGWYPLPVRFNCRPEIVLVEI